jgi:hypothetical protein
MCDPFHLMLFSHLLVVGLCWTGKAFVIAQLSVRDVLARTALGSLGYAVCWLNTVSYLQHSLLVPWNCFSKDQCHWQSSKNSHAESISHDNTAAELSSIGLGRPPVKRTMQIRHGPMLVTSHL